MKPFKKSVTGKKLEGKLTKKVTKSDVGGGVAVNNSDATSCG